MKVFVSYSRLDEQVVKALVQGLKAAHRDVWFDNDLGGGEVWWVKILQSIRQAEVVIFALSDNALHSKACRAELDYALALGRTVLPIKVGPVANFRSNPLSALQTIEFRQDALSAFGIIAAVDDAAKRLRPLPEPLPPLPPIPFAYLVSLDTQIDAEVLSPEAQINVVDELRKALREETDETVHDDILATLRKLKKKSWATVQVANEVDAVVEWARARRSQHAPDPHNPDDANPPIDGPGPSPGHDEASERQSRARFEANVADAVLQQQEERAIESQLERASTDPEQRQHSSTAMPPAPRSTWSEPSTGSREVLGPPPSQGQPWRVALPVTVVVLVLVGMLVAYLVSQDSSVTAGGAPTDSARTVPSTQTTVPTSRSRPSAVEPSDPGPRFVLPRGSASCPRVHQISGAEFTRSARGNDHTTCQFAENVRKAYLRTADAGADARVRASSPVTHKTYTMYCTWEGPDVVCTGGQDAVVYLY